MLIPSKTALAVLVGDTSAYDTLLQYMLNEIELPESPEAFILPSVDGEQSIGLGAGSFGSKNGHLYYIARN